jgi:DNA-binding NtrC family response regulator
MDAEQPLILCVDDEEDMLAAIRRVLIDLEPPSTVLTATSGDQALEILAKRRCDVAIIDLHMPKMGGMELLGRLSGVSPDVSAVVLTADHKPQTIVAAMKAGAVDYLTKPFDNQRLLVTVQNLLRSRQLQRHNRDLRRALHQHRARPFIGSSDAARQVRVLAKQAGAVRSNVLILGESGTGKEVLARSIHFHGVDSELPYVAVDCTAISPNLFESELFGHERGAFTGALEAREGLLRSAKEGSVFFDEVTEMPLALQAKLLRVIQERELRPVGSSRVFPFGGRVIAATNRDPLRALGEGVFREDLHYRLSVIPVEIPPLRERAEDIGLLARHFLKGFDLDALRPYTLSDEAEQALRAYAWPGNVRELENCIERACALGTGVDNVIGLDDLPDAVVTAGAAAGELSVGRRVTTAGMDLSGRKQEAEREAIIEALEQAGGNRTAAAKLLGMGRSTLYRKMELLGLE